MAPQTPRKGVSDSLQTSFLIPNLHCPTCITHIHNIVNGAAQPKPTVESISLIDHVITIRHLISRPAASIGELLSSNGFEVFDIVLDPQSDEILPASPRSPRRLEAAVRRWDPRDSTLTDSARSIHDANCQMCAAVRASKEGTTAIESIVVPDASVEEPSYTAVFSIDGMTCSSCVRNATIALNQVARVADVQVALVSHSATVRFTGDDRDQVVRELIDAVEDSGYGAELISVTANQSAREETQMPEEATWQAVYTVKGMTCASCVDKVMSAVKQNDFVKAADVNLASSSLTVVFEGEGNQPQLLASIKETGYETVLREVKSVSRNKEKPKRPFRLHIEGMHCSQCPQRIVEGLQQLSLTISQQPTIENPILALSYTPNAPTFTIRQIIDTVQDLDNAFLVTIQKEPSVEERSRQMLARERRAIFLRALLCLITAIPTFIIGIVYMNLAPHSSSSYKYLMHPIYGVSRAEWATFAMATPIYLFAADHFHKRTIKEVYALWKPRSTVPLLKRFYRFGSMNMLITLGTTVAYFASLADLIMAATRSGADEAGPKETYFDSVVFLTMFLLFGRLAEAHMKAKAGDAVAALGSLRPAEANLVVRQDGEKSAVETMSVNLVDIGDVVKVPLGASPPCDGVLLDDVAEFDESSLTGESRTVHKKEGDLVYSGTINSGSAVNIRVTGPAGTSMLDSIIEVVREGQAKRAPMERVADMLTSHFVPVVVLLAIVTWVVWLTLGLSGTLPDNYKDNKVGGWAFWSLQFAIAVFVIACPCGLGLAAPTALFVGSGMAAKKGILVKGGGEAFQEASKLDAVIFDKTGTLTEGGNPRVVEYRFLGDEALLDEPTLLGLLRGIEENSSHPLAKAVLDFTSSRTTTPINVLSVEEIAGRGMQATFRLPGLTADGETSEALIGSESLLQEQIPTPNRPSLPQDILTQTSNWKSSGQTVIHLAVKIYDTWTIAAVLAIATPLRPEAPPVIHALQQRKISVYMLSGDTYSTALAIAAQVGIPPQNVIAEVSPAQKSARVNFLQRTLLPSRRATIAMIGDGINDAPALTQSDVGIAVASGSNVAIQSAAFVLVHSDLRAVLELVDLSRAVFRRVVLNFFWAGVYNCLAIPVAAGVLYPVGRHVRLDPVWAAGAMAGSSVSVVGSSLLLRTGWPVVGYRRGTI